MYKAKVQEDDDLFETIDISDDQFETFSPWTDEGVAPTTLVSMGDGVKRNLRDAFDVPGKPNMRAWFRWKGLLKVMKTTSPTAITSYDTGFSDIGFTLHWPFNPGQYYAAGPWISTNNPLLKFTLDADSEEWIDTTGDLWTYLDGSGFSESVQVVGFCPYWTEG